MEKGLVEKPASDVNPLTGEKRDTCEKWTCRRNGTHMYLIIDWM